LRGPHHDLRERGQATERRGDLRLDLTRRLDLVVDFLPVDANVPRGLDAEADFASLDVHDGDLDAVTDEDDFAQLPTQNEHVASSVKLASGWEHFTDFAIFSQAHFLPGSP